MRKINRENVRQKEEGGGVVGGSKRLPIRFEIPFDSSSFGLYSIKNKIYKKINI